MRKKPPKPARSPKTKAAKKPVPITHGWKYGLQRFDSGKIQPSLLNAAIALRKHPEWQGILAYDEFALKIVLKKVTPWGYPGEWDDEQELKTAEWLQEQGINVSPNIAHFATRIVAREKSFHPVRDYLSAITHDGTARVKNWLTVYLGVPDTPYSRAVGSKWLISAVARIFKPGCKVDHVLILQTPQGMKKSTTFAILGGEWFSDDLEDLGSKDSKMAMAREWIVELSELDSMIRSDPTKAKAFISRQVDRFRPPYGHHIIERPRQAVLCGSTNDNIPLKDWTGNRRFWFVRPTKIALQSLIRDRDQLWAETVALYRNGVIWWIDEETEPEIAHMAEKEQEERVQDHPWKARIEDWLSKKGDYYEIGVSDVLEFLEKKPADWTQRDKNDIAHILQSLKLVRFRKRTDDGRAWLYRPLGDLE